MIAKNLMTLFLLLFASKPAFAYVDPGTGSMLFSIVLCSLTTLFFLFRVVFIHLKKLVFLKKGGASRKHQFVVYSEGNQYYAVFKPVLDEFEARKIPVMYYSSCQEDFLFKEKYEYIKTEYIGSGNKAYLKLAFLNADVCLMTTPQLGVLQLERSKNVKHYAHILHSIGFSYSYRLFSLDYYDSVLCDAAYQVSMIREIEHKRNLHEKQLPVVGSTYMDFNKQQILKMNLKKESEYALLIAPTWGKDSLLNQCGEKIIDQFVSTDFSVIIRPHPQSLLSDKNLIKDLMKKYEPIKNISWDLSSNNLESMAKADILLTDWSSVMLDFALLFNRPFLYTGDNISNEMYDCYDLDNPSKWKNDMLSKIGKKLTANDMENLVQVIENTKNNANYTENMSKAQTYFWAHQGESAQNVVDFLENIQKSFYMD